MPFLCKSQRGKKDVNSLHLSCEPSDFLRLPLITLAIASGSVRLGTAVSSRTTELFVAFGGSEINV